MAVLHPSINTYKMFSPEYYQNVAELCSEEMELVDSIVKSNYTRCTNQQLLQLATKELPLCLEDDISKQLAQSIHKLSTTITQANSRKDIKIDTIPAPNLGIRFRHTEDPHIDLQSKWSAEETSILNKYLSDTKGRKNWVYCARLVGTKSSSQCKSKFNNMRVQDITDDSIDI